MSPDRNTAKSDRWAPTRIRRIESSWGSVQLISTITCPHCGRHETETMPTDACQYFYECNGCGAVLKPKPGDCCVFCSYGDIKCPPIQSGCSP